MTHRATQIMCNDASGIYHRILVRDDGSIHTPDCPSAVENAEKLALAIRLGHRSHLFTCSGFVALWAHGLPAIINTKDLGSWREIYVRFEQNKLVTARMDEIKRDRDREHAATFALARKTFRAAGYFRGLSKNDLDELVSFRIEEPIVGETVAYFREDHWSIPLSPTWKRDVYDLDLAVAHQHHFDPGGASRGLERHLVLGANASAPGFFYAVQREGSAYLIREFFYNQTQKLFGAVSSAATAPATSP